jgi:hypothetical protein
MPDLRSAFIKFAPYSTSIEGRPLLKWILGMGPLGFVMVLCLFAPSNETYFTIKFTR